MRLIIDLDGTICEIKQEGQDYSEVLPKPGAVETIKKLKEKGYVIIIYTARHMRTCNGDVKLAKKKIGKITMKWLDEHGILYDEIIFGKPYGDIYIDDLGYRFVSWENINRHLLEGG